MNDPFELTEEEKFFLDHLAYETLQHHPGWVYRWCRDHDVEPYEIAPLGDLRDYEYTLEPPKGSRSAPWKSAAQFRERAKVAADFLRATGKWEILRSPNTALPMNRHEREFYGLWLGEECSCFIARASYLLAKRGLNYDHMMQLWHSYQAAWDAIGYHWCYHIPPLPLDLDLPCPWDSAEAFAIRVKELTGVSPNAGRERDTEQSPAPHDSESRPG